VTGAVLIKSLVLPASRWAAATAVEAAALLPSLSLGQETFLHCCLNANGCSKRVTEKNCSYCCYSGKRK